MASWVAITKLGDIIATMPVFGVCLAWLIWEKAWRPALWWCLLFLGGLALVAATKIAFAGWGLGIRSLDFTGFSGHAMRSTAVMPVFLYMIARSWPPVFHISGVIAGLLFGLLVTVSRLVLDVHSVSEAVSGFVLGGLVAFGFIHILRRTWGLGLNRWLIAIGVIAMTSASAAEPAPTESWVQKIAVHLSGRERPFTREDWKND